MDTPEAQQIFDLRRAPESLHPWTVTRQGTVPKLPLDPCRRIVDAMPAWNYVNPTIMTPISSRIMLNIYKKRDALLLFRISLPIMQCKCNGDRGSNCLLGKWQLLHAKGYDAVNSAFNLESRCMTVIDIWSWLRARWLNSSSSIHPSIRSIDWSFSDHCIALDCIGGNWNSHLFTTMIGRSVDLCCWRSNFFLSAQLLIYVKNCFIFFLVKTSTRLTTLATSREINKK